MNNVPIKSVSSIRTVVQWFFMLWVVGIGIRFGMFINSVESGATVPFVSRPPGVEGFLPREFWGQEFWGREFWGREFWGRSSGDDGVLLTSHIIDKYFAYAILHTWHELHEL